MNGENMRTKLLQVLLVATAATGIVAATASASGRAAPGKELVQFTCDGLGTITIAVMRGENANGAVQIVDAKGHGIPLEATLTLADLTTSTVLGTETTATGQGNGHPNQPATRCSGVLFHGPASDFFGSDLPPGVAPTSCNLRSTAAPSSSCSRLERAPSRSPAVPAGLLPSG
jgi:hypothetical protein